MKIVLDCIVTAKDPRRCSTNIQFLTFVDRVLKRRDDVFFYWLVPHWLTEDELKEAYPQHPNISYIRMKQHRDRTKEYLTLPVELDQVVAFNGTHWDFDVLLTVRSGMLPVLKMLATSPRTHSYSWMRQFWLIEAMVLMDFKKTVLTFDAEAQDLFTLSGYLAADRVYLTSQVDKPEIVARARELLAPSRAMKVREKVVPVGYAQFMESHVKGPETFPDPQNGKPMCIAYVGRMEKANRIEAINDIMVNSFVMNGDKVKLLCCTVSATWRTFDTSIIDIRMASRDEFWELAKSEMHLVVNLSDEGGSSLSLLEPMMFGVPAIVGPRKRTEAALGKDYPFIVNNETEAYALTKMFYEDYAGMYAKWKAWQADGFQKLLKARLEQASVYDLLDKDVDGFAQVTERMKKERAGKADNAFVKDVLKEVGDAKEFVLSEVVDAMVAKKLADKKLAEKLTPGDRDTRGLVWSTDFNEVRRILIAFYGWTDASVKVGHFKRAA